MEHLNQKDRVMRLIIRPMQDRWEPPKGKGLNLDIILADYIADLGKFSESVLTQAFDTVRRGHDYNTWPKLSEFYKACKTFDSTSQLIDYSPAELDLYQRSNKAHEYAKTELAKKGLRPYQERWWREARKFLFEHACEQLRRGLEPNVPIDEDRIQGWIAA